VLDVVAFPAHVSVGDTAIVAVESVIELTAVGHTVVAGRIDAALLLTHLHT
jgi:hypothetical protein